VSVDDKPHEKIEVHVNSLNKIGLLECSNLGLEQKKTATNF